MSSTRVLRRTGLLCLWLYVVLLGGTWAVISSFGVRLLSQMMLIAIIVGWLAVRAYRGQRLPETALDRPILAFLGAAALATAFSINRSLSMEATLLWTGYALLYYLLVALAASQQGEMIALLMAAGAIIAVGALAEPVLWYFGLAPGAGWTVAWPSVAPDGMLLPPVLFRPGTVTGNANVLGGYLAPLVPLGLAVAVGHPGQAYRRLAWLWTFSVALATVATISRGGLLAMASGLAGFGVLWVVARHADKIAGHLSTWRQRAALGGAAILIVATVIWRFLPPAGAQSGSDGVRVELWGYALTMVRQRPLIGVGPDTFGLSLLQLRPAAARAEDLLPHAHNLYLGLTAEIGLLGLASAMWLGAVVGRAWWRGARAAAGRQRLLLTGLMAGLVATAVHGMVEDFRIFPLIVIHGMAFVALIVAGPAANAAGAGWGEAEPHLLTPLLPGGEGVDGRGAGVTGGEDSGLPNVSDKRCRAPGRGMPARLLIGPAAALVAIALWTSFIRWELDVGVRLADAGRWQEAQGYLDAAAGHDPGISLHAFQAGLGRGRLAATGGEGSAENLAKAIDTYDAALLAEPSYALNRANLAALLWQAGERARAVSEMARAVSMRPAEARYQLNLAAYYQAQGRDEAAEQEYVRLLLAEPGIMRSRAWQSALASGISQDKVLERAWAWLADEPIVARSIRRGQLMVAADKPEEAAVQFRLAVDRDATSTEAWSGLGEALAGSGRWGEAAAALRQAVKLSPRSVARHAELAMALAEEGAMEEARREARLALFMEPNATAHLVLARLARGQEMVDEAIGHYRAALAGDSSYVAYGLVAWRRAAIQRDSLPQLMPVGPSREDVAVYRELGTYLAREGRIEEAVTVYQRWLAHDPWAQSEVSAALNRLGHKL